MVDAVFWRGVPWGRDGLLVDHDARGELERVVPQLLRKAATVAAMK